MTSLWRPYAARNKLECICANLNEKTHQRRTVYSWQGTEVKLSADKISKNVFALPVFTLIWISLSQKPSRVLWSLPLSPMSNWSSFCKAQHYKHFNSFLYFTQFRKFTWLNTEILALFLKNWQLTNYYQKFILKKLFIVKNHMNLEVSQWRNWWKVSSWR